MSITVNTNLSALLVQSNLKQASNSSNNAMQRMSTGYKINHAKDNAAGYSIATKMSVKLSALKQAEDNASMGLDMVQTASSTLDTMSNLTSHLRALATQAQNGTNGTSSIDALNSEATAIIKEIDRIKSTAKYNGIDLLGKSSSSNFIKEVQRRDTSSMTTLASVDENTRLTSGTYSISTAEELAKLATMTNNGKIGNNTEFVLANNIDLSAYSTGEGWTPIGNTYRAGFYATFDGNGFEIANLYINGDSSLNFLGLFGMSVGATIKNLGIVDAEVTGYIRIGALVGNVSQSTITNCYVNSNVNGKNMNVGCLAGCVANSSLISDCYATGSANCDNNTGGLIGYVDSNSIISNSYSNSIVNADYSGGGLLGVLDNKSTVSNCYATGDVIGSNRKGGLIGYVNSGDVLNSYATGSLKSNYYTGGLVGSVYGTLKLENSYYTDTTGVSNASGAKYSGSTVIGTADKISMQELDDLISQGILMDYKKATLNFQVGTNSTSNSQLSIEFANLDISWLNGLQMDSANALSTIDKVLKEINERQTYFGSVENRLTSALDSISISYENLLSSRSTLRDADVAKESSVYIRNQILLNASATLLATANQSPAIALQLIQGR